MSEVLRVGIDVTAVPARPAGAGYYVIELVRALSARPDLLALLYARRDDRARWAGIAGGGVRALAPRARPARLAFEELALGPLAALERPRLEVLHGPHYGLPYWTSEARVVTVHDLTFVEHPEWHERAKVVLFSRALRLAAARADAVVCVSEAVGAAFSERYAPRAPVFIAPHGVNPGRFHPTSGGDEGDGQVLARLDVREPYVLHVGTLEPRKNLPLLVAAFDRLAAREPALSLVLAGGAGWGNDALARAIATAKHGALVQRLGYVEDDDVPALLRRAAVVAYPSRSEGFGIPALEALASGAPLVTTRDSVMAEVAGDAAWLVDPDDTDALADALAEALGAGPDVARRRAAGLARAAAYRWDRSAAVHVEAYRAALAGAGAARRARRPLRRH